MPAAELVANATAALAEAEVALDQLGRALDALMDALAEPAASR